MISNRQIRRRWLARVGSSLLVLSLSPLLFAQGRGPQGPPPPRPAPQGARPVPQMGPRTQPPGGQRQPREEHLSQWMERHRNLSPQEQERALRSEPGFNRLPPEVQARSMNRLQQLNSMPPQRRERFLNRAEAFEHMEPQQRQQVRGALGQLGSLPPDRRRAVARAWRDLRSMPADQRNSALNSEAYRGFSNQERSTLGNLLQVEPYLPQERGPQR